MPRSSKKLIRILPPEEYSPGKLDPAAHLAACVLVISLQDLRSADSILALEALAFWLDDESISGWLEMIGYEFTIDIFTKAIGEKNANTKRCIGRRDSSHEHTRARQVSEIARPAAAGNHTGTGGTGQRKTGP